MAANAAPSSTASPEPTLVVTALCKQKAAYIAHEPAEWSPNRKFGTAIFTVCCAMMILICAWRFEMYRSPTSRQSKQRRTVFFTMGTVGLVLMAICFATYSLYIQHDFYCIEEATREQRHQDWLFAGLVVCPFVLLAFFDWLYLATNLVYGALKGDQLNVAWSFYLLGPLAVLLATILLAIYEAGYWIWSLLRRRRNGSRLSFAGKLQALWMFMKRGPRNGGNESQGIELAELGGIVRHRHGGGTGYTIYGPQHGKCTMVSRYDTSQASIEATTSSEPAEYHSDAEDLEGEGSRQL